jgi:hypothetical protein
VGYGPFSLWKHKEGLCPSSGDINRLMMMMFLYLDIDTKELSKILKHTYRLRFIPEGAAGTSQIFLRDTRMLLQFISGMRSFNHLVAF